MARRNPAARTEGQLGAIIIALVLATGIAAWCVRLANQTLDYDEVQRAHSIWMTSEGLTPYQDFLECHPPYFVLLSPLVTKPSSPESLLITLRIVAMLGNLLFIAGVGVASVAVAGLDRRVAWFCTSIVAFHPSVLQYLSEFRIDGWGYAVVVWSGIRLSRSEGRWRHAEFGLTTGLATLLLSPKLTVLAPAMALFEAARVDGVLKRIRAFGSYGAGVLASVLLFWGFLLVGGIPIGRTYEFLIRYHVLANSHSGFGYGLFRMVADVPILSIPIVLGVLTYGWKQYRSKAIPDSFSGSVAIWLIVSVALVSYPYKQYSAPWLLFGSLFVSVLGMELLRQPRYVVAVASLILCGLSMWTSGGQIHTLLRTPEARQQLRILELMSQASDPADHVVATPPCHPIDRLDSSFIWFNTIDPKSYGTEGILSESAAYREIVSERRYQEELDTHPPAYVVVQFWSLYPPRLRSVLERYLEQHAYVPATLGGLQFAVRPDRYDRFARLAAEGRR